MPHRREFSAITIRAMGRALDDLVRFLAGFMAASKRAADQTTRIPGAGTPGYPFEKP
jgi:hypothetical protein